MRESLAIHIRVIYALVLREARVRHGRSRLGYSLAIIEPFLLISFLALIFSAYRQTSREDFVIFFATGVLTFQLYMRISQYIAGSFLANKPLLNYPRVKQLDTVIARFVLEYSTHLLVMALAFTFIVIVMRAPPPNNLAGCLFWTLLTATFALGAGLGLAEFRKVIPLLDVAYNILMGPAFFVSAIFYSVNDVPPAFKDLLLWNPILHCVEGFRSVYFAGYRAPDISPGYVCVWAFTLIFTGLMAEACIKRAVE